MKTTEELIRNLRGIARQMKTTEDGDLLISTYTVETIEQAAEKIDAQDAEIARLKCALNIAKAEIDEAREAF